MNHHITLAKNNSFSNSNEIHLLNYQHEIDFFRLIPKTFVISTNKEKYHFNIEMLKYTSTIISKFLQTNTDCLEYHLDFDDENHILEKIEHMYEGKSVIFEENDRLALDQINQLLQISLFSNQPMYQYYMEECSSTFEVTKNNILLLIEDISFQTFTIITKNHEYNCNIFGILSSKVILDFLIQNPTTDHYNYDFDDNCSEFQYICDIFNFKKTQITIDNIQSLKNIAEDLQITYILDIICQKFNEFSERREKIDNQQTLIDSIDELFDHLYRINDITVSKVTKFIIKSPWSSSNEKVYELAAFILQVVKSDISLRYSITELLIELENKSKKIHNLSVLIPFLIKKLMNSFGESKFNCSFLYVLRQKGIISQKDIEDKINSKSINKNIVDWFLPEISQLKPLDLEYYILRKDKNKFFQYYYPNNIDKYIKMLESGEPDDKITLFLLHDDIESFKNAIIKENIDIIKNFVPYNIYDKFTKNGRTSFLDYAVAHGSINCFKYLLLNHAKLSTRTYKYAIYGGNDEIIRTINQKIEELQPKKLNVEDLLKTSIIKNQNNLFDWIFDEKVSNDAKSNSLFNKLSLISCKNGNAHSLIRIIEQSYDSINITNTIQACSKNGFYSLLQIIMNLCDISCINFKSIRESFIVFGNLSIFILYTKFMDQDDFNFFLKYAIKIKCIEIIEYMLKSDRLSAIDDYDILNSYGYMLYSGDGVEINKEEAAKLYKLAADKGDIEAMKNYASMLYNGYGVEINKKEAAKYFKLAADKGDTTGMNYYGNMLDNGDGIEINKEEAVKWFKLASEKGNTIAMNNYAIMIYKGDGVEINKEEAMKWFKLASEKGNIKAMINYAIMLENGDGVEINKEEAAKWYKLAASKGNTEAMYNYAIMLENGDGVEINKEEAVKWYKLAASKGNTKAMNRVGCFLLRSNPENCEEACLFFKMAANKNQPTAMINYGFMMDNGYGTPVNHEKADQLYKKLIENGNAKLFFDFSNLLDEGIGEIPINLKESLRYCKIAADAGYIEAIYKYAKMVENGISTDCNIEEAIKYYKIASEMSNDEASKDYKRLTSKS